ncbi:hypothetical protein KCU88_g422, partial [Aureobasidium melanogenum]
MIEAAWTVADYAKTVLNSKGVLSVVNSTLPREFILIELGTAALFRRQVFWHGRYQTVCMVGGTFTQRRRQRILPLFLVCSFISSRLPFLRHSFPPTSVLEQPTVDLVGRQMDVSHDRAADEDVLDGAEVGVLQFIEDHNVVQLDVERLAAAEGVFGTGG